MALVQESLTIGGRDFIKTYSDQGMKIERQDGILFDDAVDPVDMGRTYTETDIPIEGETAEEIVSILLGGEEE